MIYRYPNMSRFFQGFPRELNFNILIHVVTHIYKLIGEEIVWWRFSWQISEISDKMPLHMQYRDVYT